MTLARPEENGLKTPKPPILTVRDWNERHENSKSRAMLDTRWFPMPNDLSADEYVELVDHPGRDASRGAAPRTGSKLG
jgi:hypothetical protein